MMKTPLDALAEYLTGPAAAPGIAVTCAGRYSSLKTMRKLFTDLAHQCGITPGMDTRQAREELTNRMESGVYHG